MSGTADPLAFRRAMSRWATGVSVVTTHADGADAGLTVNAFLSVSLEPPVVLVSLTRDATTTPLIDRSGRYAVNLLAADQRTLSERFALAVPSVEKFDGVAVHRGIGEVPLLDGALVHLECRVRSIEDVADHRLFLGLVERVHAERDAPPLLYYRSRYGEPDANGRLALTTAPDPPPPDSNPRPPS